MNIAQYIEHTLLKADATSEDIRTLCAQAREYKFACVVVNPSWVTLATDLLRDSSTAICTVVGFPLGASTSASKAAEAQEAVKNGATEIDMVIHIGVLKEGHDAAVQQDIETVRRAVPNAVLKVILETSLLTNEEKVRACTLAQHAGADFVKTSTGFSNGGATAEDIKLMRRTIGTTMGVKASGGIRDFATAKAMIDAGANRIGCSASVEIIQNQK